MCFKTSTKIVKKPMNIAPIEGIFMPTDKKRCPEAINFRTSYLFGFVLSHRLAVNLLHVSDEFENLVRVTDLIVIPRNNLNEGVGQSDTSLSVED